MSLLDHLLLLLVAVGIPLNQYMNRAQFRETLFYNTTERKALYRQLVIVLWTMAAIVIALWLFQGRSLSSIGLLWRVDAGFWGGLLLAGSSLAALQLYYRWQLADDVRRRKLRELSDRLAPFMPRTREAMRAFDALAVSAGICEEVLYRGFFFWYAASILGTDLTGVAATIVATSAVFALGHVYQGARGFGAVFATGMVQGAVYALSGSLWIAMALHAGLDLLAGRVSLRLHPEGDPISSATVP